MFEPIEKKKLVDKLNKGVLTEAELVKVLDDLILRKNESLPCQKLLYLQAHSTSVDSPVNGMSIIENGEIHLPPEDYDDWPYHTVLDAMKDGWRIIKFPDLSLLYSHPDEIDRILGCEFVLEK